MLILIVLLAVSATWIALPGDSYDINDVRSDNPLRQGLDLQGGLQVLLEARPPSGESVDGETLEATRDTLETRVNALGVSEPLVQTRGGDQIVVELPGVDDPDEAVEILQDTALLEIIDSGGEFLEPGTIVRTSLGDPDTARAGEATPEGATPEDSAQEEATPAAEEAPDADGPVYETIVSGTDLQDAYQTTGEAGQPLVAFELSGDATSTFYEFTRDNIGQPMPILLDKEVISSPRINAAIAGSGVIEGVPPEDVGSLALQLRAGALGVPMEVVSSQTVGPSLGQDSISRSLTAGIVGLLAIAAFMIVYYRVPGVLSVLALLIYTAMCIAVFRLFPVTMTLPGIAAFILSIGMAIDSNVLIFARMKEELRRSRPLDDAIEAGFNYAWPSIRDSNVSTMITCVILYWFGQFTGATIIMGFALTLFIGVAISLFTAITVTRTFLRLMVNVPWTINLWWLGLGRNEVDLVAEANQTQPATPGD